MASTAFPPTTKTALTTIKDTIVGKVLSGSTATALTAASPTVWDASLNNVFTLTPTGSVNINISNSLPGQRLTLIILTSGTSSYTQTFNTGFKTTGTLATGTSDAKYFVLNFISDGTTVYEVSRTTAM